VVWRSVAVQEQKQAMLGLTDDVMVMVRSVITYDCDHH